MNKNIIITISTIVLLCIISIFISKTNNRKIEIGSYIELLSRKNIVYIPSVGDVALYKNTDYLNVENHFYVNTEMTETVNAFYNLYKSLSISEIDKLLHHKKPNIRIYAYLYYIGRNKDMNYEYLLSSINDCEITYYSNEYLFEEKCFTRDILLLTALSCIDIQLLYIPNIDNDLVLTDEQKETLFMLYVKKQPINKELDQKIQECLQIQ